MLLPRPAPCAEGSPYCKGSCRRKATEGLNPKTATLFYIVAPLRQTLTRLPPPPTSAGRLRAEAYASAPTTNALRNFTGRCGHSTPYIHPIGFAFIHGRSKPLPYNRRPYARAANFSHRASEASFLISSLLSPHFPPRSRNKKAGGIPPPAQQTSQVASDPDQSSRYLSS